jgi:hypothetical protein
VRRKVIAAALVLALSIAAGMTVGLWWATSTGEQICDRLEKECGEQAMPRDDCLVGRQQDLLRYGPGAMRKVDACLAKAPHDCMAVNACVATAGTN